MDVMFKWKERKRMFTNSFTFILVQPRTTRFAPSCNFAARACRSSVVAQSPSTPTWRNLFATDTLFLGTLCVGACRKACCVAHHVALLLRSHVDDWSVSSIPELDELGLRRVAQRSLQTAHHVVI